MAPLTDATLGQLARSHRWDELDAAWQAAVELPDPPHDDLLAALDAALKAGKGTWAEASAWAWLVQVKEREPPAVALKLARELLMRLPDGSDLRSEVLDLYRQTHAGAEGLEAWIERSGLSGSASVRRALRYLDVALHLRPGAFLIHRTDDTAAEVVRLDPAADAVEVRARRGARTLTVAQVIDEYNPTDADDFRVLRQLRPERIAELAHADPLQLLVGILRARGGRIDRDELKLLLSPSVIAAGAWADWWTRLRSAIKKSPHVTLEGRSPTFVVYHEAGRTLEEEAGEALARAGTPRELLSTVETYLRECKARRSSPDAGFLERLARQLDEKVNRLARFDADQAFGTALVVERLATEGLPLPEDVPGLAQRMMASSAHPARLILAVPDPSLFPLATACARQAFPERWPELFSEVLPLAPTGQCDDLALQLVTAERGPTLLQDAVDRILANPREHVEGLMWLWRGPSERLGLRLPSLMVLWNLIIHLVGPTRESGRKDTARINALRAVVRAGLSHRDYAQFRRCLEGQEEAMGAAIQRQVERAEGLGPVVQDALSEHIRAAFPRLYVRAKVEPWNDPNVLWVTQAGKTRKEAELDELVNVKMRNNAIAIGKAAEHGDLSENSEYKFALEERDLLRARLAQMNLEMSLARVLEAHDVPAEHVGIGHRVHLVAADGGDRRTLTILGPWESDVAREIYSYQAPLVKPLLGRKGGDLVELPDPRAASTGGDKRTYRIESFEPAI